MRSRGRVGCVRSVCTCPWGMSPWRWGADGRGVGKSGMVNYVCFERVCHYEIWRADMSGVGW